MRRRVKLSGKGRGGSRTPSFFSLLKLPLPFPDVFCESLFFRIKTFGVGCDAFVNVSLSAERVLESLEQKGEGNDSMSSGEES